MKSFIVGVFLALPLVAWLWLNFGDTLLALYSGLVSDAPQHSKLLDWRRWLVWFICAGLHYHFCAFSPAQIEEIIQKQPKSSGGFNQPYAKELKDKHATLGHLVNIGYTDFLIIKKSDLAWRKWRYFFGFFLLFLVAYVLFADF